MNWPWLFEHRIQCSLHPGPLRFRMQSLCILETVQEFLYELGIKTRIQKWFCGNDVFLIVIVRPTSIINNLLKDHKFLIFQHWKSVEWVFFSLKNIRLEDLLLLLIFLIHRISYFLKMFPILVGSVNNFVRSDDDIM